MNETHNQDSHMRNELIKEEKEAILFGMVTRFLLYKRKVSIGDFKCHFNLKWSHAADLMLEMQEKGFVSEAAANGQHKVFGREQEYNEILKADNDWEKRLFLWADIYEMSESDFPRDKVKLMSMKKLTISGYDIGFIPAEIGLLTQLEELNLSNNHLSEFPESLLNLVNLKWLNLERNEFLFLPIDKNEILQWLCAHCTKLSRVSEILTNQDLLETEFQKWKDENVEEFPNEIEIMRNRGCEVLFSTYRNELPFCYL